ncbi:PulJ/GspJ family protein [Coraliomargarita sp. W4R53]
MDYKRISNQNQAGMSFLEVLLAVAMLGLLMVAGSTMLYSFTRTYFTLETGPEFDRHADGIVEMLDYLASVSSAPDAPFGRHYEWKESPISKQPTLSFTLDQDIPFFVSELVPLPAVRAFLEFQEEENQFWLVWYAELPKTNRKSRRTNHTPDYQYTLLSPWAGDIEYGYYDPEQKTWEFEMASSDARQHAKQRPSRVQLIFDREGLSLRRYIDFNSENKRVLTY